MLMNQNLAELHRFMFVLGLSFLFLDVDLGKSAWHDLGLLVED